MTSEAAGRERERWHKKFGPRPNLLSRSRGRWEGEGQREQEVWQP